MDQGNFTTRGSMLKNMLLRDTIFLLPRDVKSGKLNHDVPVVLLSHYVPNCYVTFRKVVLSYWNVIVAKALWRHVGGA